MNESDAGDDETSCSLALAVSHAATSTSNVTSTVTTSNGNSVSSSPSSSSAAATATTTVASFITKQMYHLPLTTSHEASLKQSVTGSAGATVSSPPSFQLIDETNLRPSPCDSFIESQSNNSSPFMNVTSGFPASTDHGFPDEFFTALRDLFAVLDDSKRGSVKVADIEKRWVDDDSTVFSPKGLTDCLRKVSTCNGTVDFDRFCAAIKICLLKNQTLLAKPESAKTGGEEEEEEEEEREGEEEQAEARHKDDEEEDKDDYERHALPHTVNQQVPSSPSEVTFVRGGSVNSNCTLPGTAPYHHTKVNSALESAAASAAAAASVSSRSHNAQATSKIYANSSCIQHPSSLLHGHHQQRQQHQLQQQQRKLSSTDEQLLPSASCLVFGENDQSNGHPVVNSARQSDCVNNREQLARPDPLASASFHNRFIGTTAAPNVYEHQYSHNHHHHHQQHQQQQRHLQQQQHPHSPSSMVNQFFTQRKTSSNVHPNTRNHIISPCEAPLPPNPTASSNRVTKLTTTTAPVLAKPPHAYSILRRIASETAASSSSASTSNGHHTSSGAADGKSKMNNKNIQSNYLVDTCPLPANKCSTVPRTKDRKFRANNFIQMFKNFKLNSVIERTMNSSKQHSSESSTSPNCNGLSRVDSKQGRSKNKDDDHSTVSKATKSEVSSDSSFSGSSGLHQQQVPLPAPPGAPSSHASSSVDFMEVYPLPHLASSANSDSYIPHPPNVINSYGMIPPPALDEAGEEDLPLHFQSSRTQMMRRKRDRRHTVSHGIDYNHIKKMQILQHEKDILLRGLQAVERAKDWYLKQMADVTDKIRSAGRTFAPVPSDSCQAANERLQFRANRIIAANAHLIALMDEANFPIHMNLAFKPLLVPHSTDPIINLNVNASSCIPVTCSSFSSTQARECGQVKGSIAPASTGDKNGHLSQLESEKAAFLHMFHSNASPSSPSRKGSTSDCPFV